MAFREDEDTKINPGQADYDQKVKNINKAEGAGNFDDSNDNSGELVDKTRGGEENPSASWKNNVSGLAAGTASEATGVNLSGLRKKGPIAGIVGVIIAAAVGVTSLTSIPALLIVQVKEVFSHSLNDAGPALSSRTNLMLTRKISSVGDAFNESTTGECGIKCKFGTINETMKLNLEAPENGFKVDVGDKKFGGRYTIKSLTFPDGHTVYNTADFKAALSDPVRASAFSKVFNSRTAFFLNSKFGNALKTKLGLDKLSKWTGDTREKAIASLRKALGLQGDSAATDPTLKLSPEERASAGPLKPVMEAVNSAQSRAAGKTATIVGGACALYDMSRTITFAEKAQKIAAFAAFAMLFLNLADKIKAGDNPDPAVVAEAGNQLTSFETNQTNADGTPNTNYGKSATDAVGYRMDAYQDTAGTLSAEDQMYSVSPTNILATALSTLTGYLISTGATSIAASRLICKAANSPAVAALTSCGPELAVALGSAETGVGPIAAAGECAGKTVFNVVAMGKAIGTVAGKVIGAIVKGAEIPTLDEMLVGAAVGNALHSGTASIMGAAASSYGMKAGSQADIKQYAIDTAAINSQNDAIARYEAQSTPLDVTNQYSFLGTLVRNTGLISGQSASMASYVSSIASIIPRSFASLVDPASAASVATAAEAKANLYNNTCSDPSLKNVGVDADAFCNPSYVMSSSELSADSGAVVDYMTQNGFISDISGNPDPSIPNYNPEYQKYLDNCANRKDPLGETSASITDDDYEWKVGLKCTENSPELSNFRVYTMDKSINDTLDGDVSDSTSNSGASTTTPSTGELYTDSTNVACANGTTDAGTDVGYDNGQAITIRLCSIPGTIDSSFSNQPMHVNSRVSGAFLALIQAMGAATGSPVHVTSSFRTMAEQIKLFNSYGTVRAAKPGYSNHQMGLAVDFQLPTGNNTGEATKSPGADKIYDWLTANASNYGIAKLSTEAWHWQAAGAH